MRITTPHIWLKSHNAKPARRLDVDLDRESTQFRNNIVSSKRDRLSDDNDRLSATIPNSWKHISVLEFLLQGKDVALDLIEIDSIFGCVLNDAEGVGIRLAELRMTDHMQ